MVLFHELMIPVDAFNHYAFTANGISVVFSHHGPSRWKIDVSLWLQCTAGSTLVLPILSSLTNPASFAEHNDVVVVVVFFNYLTDAFLIFPCCYDFTYTRLPGSVSTSYYLRTVLHLIPTLTSFLINGTNV